MLNSLHEWSGHASLKISIQNHAFSLWLNSESTCARIEHPLFAWTPTCYMTEYIITDYIKKNDTSRYHRLHHRRYLCHQKLHNKWCHQMTDYEAKPQQHHEFYINSYPQYHRLSIKHRREVSQITELADLRYFSQTLPFPHLPSVWSSSLAQSPRLVASVTLMFFSCCHFCSYSLLKNENATTASYAYLTFIN